MPGAMLTYAKGDVAGFVVLRDEVRRDLQKFCSENPQLDFTMNDFANALRKVATDKEAKEMAEAAAQASRRVDELKPASRPHLAVPKYLVYAPQMPQHCSAKKLRSDDQATDDGQKQLSDYPGFNEFLDSFGTTSTMNNSALLNKAGEAVRSFHGGANMGSRRAPPAPLNLSIPGATPEHQRAGQQQAKPTPAYTHYLAVPSTARYKSPMERIAIAQSVLNSVSRGDGQKPLLMRTPLALLPPTYPHLGAVRAIENSVREPDQLATALKDFSLATPATAKFTRGTFERHRIRPSPPGGQWSRAQRTQGAINHGDGNLFHRKRFNLFAALTRNPNFLIEIGGYLHPKDLLNLYSVSRSFHHCINNFLLSSIGSWSQTWAPNTFSISPWYSSPPSPSYSLDNIDFSIPDPSQRTTEDFPKFQHNNNERRMVPTLKYYAFITHRQETAAEILATLARAGLRCPKGTLTSLLKIWRLMELPTNELRKSLIADFRLFSNNDLVSLQIFIVKLLVRFNDPMYDGVNPLLMQLFMGQKSLYPLWQMLFGHKYRNTHELIQLKLRYDFGGAFPGWTTRVHDDVLFTQGNDAKAWFGVPPTELGKTHLEHWGTKVERHGEEHLMRPDELVIWEATRRHLHLEEHLIHFFLWGHVDQVTGRNLAPTAEEIYIHDAKYKNRSIDTSNEFGLIECMKDKWNTLDKETRQKVFTAQMMKEDRIREWEERGDQSNPEESNRDYANAISQDDKTRLASQEPNGKLSLGDLLEDCADSPAITGLTNSSPPQLPRWDEYSDSDDERFDKDIDEALNYHLNKVNDLDFHWSPDQFDHDAMVQDNNAAEVDTMTPEEESGPLYSNDPNDLAMLEQNWIGPPTEWIELDEGAWAGFRHQADDSEDEDEDADDEQDPMELDEEDM